MANYYEFVNPRWIWRTLIVVGCLVAMALLFDTWHQLKSLHVAVAVAESERGINAIEIRDMKEILFEVREAVHDFAESRKRAIDALREHGDGRR